MKYLILLCFLSVGCTKTFSFDQKEWSMECTKTKTVHETQCVSFNKYSLLIDQAHAYGFGHSISHPMHPLNPISPLNPWRNKSSSCSRYEVVEKQVCIQYLMTKKDN